MPELILPAPRIHVRTYSANDLDDVRKLFVDGMASYAQCEGQNQQVWTSLVEHSLSSDLADIERTYFEPGGHYWVATATTARVDGVNKGGGSTSVVVGMIGLEKKNDSVGELRRMSVHSDYRRLGIGRQLIATLEQWSARNGIETVALTTGDVMQQAQTFYLSMGYLYTRTELLFEQPRVEILHYEKQLPRLTTSQAEAIRLRSYRASDYNAVRELFVDGARQAECGDDKTKTLWDSLITANLSLDLADIESAYIMAGGFFWVATITQDGGMETVVGMVGLENKYHGVGELRRMSIAKQSRRLGLGRRLVATLEQWAKDNGFHKIILSTADVMTQAQPFYQALGYAVTGAEVVFQDPLIRITHLEKSLDDP